MTRHRDDPTLGLTAAMRTALCDAANGLLGNIGGVYRRQATAHFLHSPATIAALVERHLLRHVDPDVVAPTWRGRRIAATLRARRKIIANWERLEAHRRGAAKARALRQSYRGGSDQCTAL